MKSIYEIKEETRVDLQAGLSPVQVERSRSQYGVNELTSLPRIPAWKKFLAHFNDPIIKVLLVAICLSLLVALIQRDPTHMIEAVGIVLAVALATGLSFLSEYRSDREFELLNASSRKAIHAKVLREGRVAEVAVRDIVLGDIVFLDLGDEIPADGRLLKATDLAVDQSLMTGESVPVPKSACLPDEAASGFEHPGCVYRGTQVVDGNGTMLVTAVGDHTELGTIARSLTLDDLGEETPEDVPDGGKAGTRAKVRGKLSVSRVKTPLQKRLAELGDLISKGGYIAGGFIFLALFLRGIFSIGGETPEITGFNAETLRALLNYFTVVIIIIVVAVPEGLPTSVTISLALAMRKMTRAKSLVRQLMACETIGAATVICSDKTGTLTKNKMEVQRYGIPGKTWSLDLGQTIPEFKHASLESDGRWTCVDRVALNSVLNSTAHLERKAERWVPVGNRTEGALLQWVGLHGLEYLPIREAYTPFYQLHFSSERKRMSTVLNTDQGVILFLKGAPEIILGFCERYSDENGEEHPLTEEARSQFLKAIEEAMAEAMRVLAFAHRVLPDSWPATTEGIHARKDELERDLVLDGFFAISDPLREDVAAAVRECRTAGIEVKMVTGDNLKTAKAIASRIGLMDTPDALALTSEEFEALNETEKRETVPRLRILARAKPRDKFDLVGYLHDRDEVVAVTGDGTNDAPALKRADVGLSMGLSGSDVAREASKIVLLDDAFSTIVKAVHWGRSLYENIQRFLQFQLTINISALAIAFLGPFFGVSLPFTVIQLLWINLIMDTLAAFSLCAEPPRPGLMDRPPRRPHDHIITREMVRTMFSTAVFFIVVMMTFLVLIRPHVVINPELASLMEREKALYWQTLFFNVYVFFQLWNMLNCRSLDPRESAFYRIGKNGSFIVTILGIVLVQFLAVTFGGTVFRTTPLGFWEWVLSVGATSSVLIFGELVRKIRSQGMMPPPPSTAVEPQSG